MIGGAVAFIDDPYSSYAYGADVASTFAGIFSDLVGQEPPVLGQPPSMQKVKKKKKMLKMEPLKENESFRAGTCGRRK
jgi:hypothetical protein